MLLASNGFIQGFAYNSSNQPISGATVQLLTASNMPFSPPVTTTTNSDGYYAFNGVAQGTYNVEETATGYGTSVSGSDIQTTINPASAINGNTEIQVTVLDPSQQSITATWNGSITGATTYSQLNASSYNQVGPFNSETEAGAELGYLPITLSANQGNIQNFESFCSDLFHGVYGGVSFTVQPSLTPDPINNTSLTANLGEIGYLYNTYGTSVQTGGPGASTNGAALQLALWALEYNPNGSLNLNDADTTQPFAVFGPPSTPSTAQDIISAANADLAAAFGKSEDAYFLNLNTPAEENGTTLGQGMFSTDLLNFTNTVSLATPAINTSQQPATATVGTSIADKATVTGLVSPSSSDTVTFNLYSSATTQNSTTLLFSDTETVSISGSTATATSKGYTATATGTDYWVATYNGDSNNNSVTSTANAEPVVISPATPAINTSQQPATATVGTSIADKATVTGLVSPSSSDTVTFNLYSSATTQNSTTLLFSDTETVSISGSTATATSKGYTATATGTDYWVATYNGDSNNNSVTSTANAEPVVISPATPAINTSQQPATATVGTSIADKATVTGLVSPSSSDTVTFNLYSSATTQNSATLLFSDTETVSISGSTATATSKGYTATATGTDYWVATYNGDSNNNSVTSTANAEPVTIHGASGPPPVVSTAIYNAATNQPISGNLPLGSSVYDTATVTGGVNPTGTVTFNLYNNPNGTGMPLFTDAKVPLVSGMATSTGYTATATGTDYWVATYNGDSNNSPVSSGTASEPVTITTASPPIRINTSQQPATATVGTSIADTATVTGGDNPTGTVTFNLYNNSTASGTPLFTDANVPLVGTMATSTGYTATATGADYWVATYNGDSNNVPVTSDTASEPVVVSPATPMINTSQQPAIATVGSSIADKATVSGGFNPTGTVTFVLYSNPNGTGRPLFTDANVPLVSGMATSTGYTATATGTDYWVATYNGDSNNAAVTSGTAVEPVIISPATPMINTSQQPATATVGTSIADKATVTGGVNPTGTVTFNLYNNPNGTGTPLYTDANVALVGGVATSVGYTATATGTDYWVATYSGDSNNAAVTSGTAVEPVTILGSSIDGTVFCDCNNDGIQQPTEVGIPGVTLTLTGTTGAGASVTQTTTTDANGLYGFSEPPGTYTITESAPAGYFEGKTTAGTAGGTVSGVTISNITLLAGVEASGYNFANLTPSMLSGVVYYDLNHNGVMDSDDFGIAHVTVTLDGTNDLGQSINMTTVTNNNGVFSFGDLRPGTYDIIRTQPAIFRDYKNTAGSLGGTVNKDSITDISVPACATGVDYLFGELQQPTCRLRNLAISVGNLFYHFERTYQSNPVAFAKQYPNLTPSIAAGQVPWGKAPFPSASVATYWVPTLGTKPIKIYPVKGVKDNPLVSSNSGQSAVVKVAHAPTSSLKPVSVLTPSSKPTLLRRIVRNSK